MDSTSLTEPASTFVLRFWVEWSEGSPLWRGSIRHLQSGRQLAFQDLEGARGFIDTCLAPPSRRTDAAPCAGGAEPGP